MFGLPRLPENHAMSATSPVSAARLEEIRKTWKDANVTPLWETMAHKPAEGGPKAYLWKWRTLRPLALRYWPHSEIEVESLCSCCMRTPKRWATDRATSVSSAPRSPSNSRSRARPMRSSLRRLSGAASMPNSPAAKPTVLSCWR
jgi:hypothetical protein